MKVLHVTPSFYPAIKWGGPIFSTKAICDGVSELPNTEVSVLTTDAAGPAVSDKLDLSRNEKDFPAGYKVTYARRIAGHSISLELLRRLPGAINRADVVHLTGTYNFPTLLTLLFARLLRTPVVWSPRGALQATATWSGSPRVRMKIAFEYLAQIVRPQNTVLLVTSKEEGRDSIARLKNISVVILPNSVELPEAQKTFPTDSPARPIILIFLSRIHPKKGIELLLDAMRKLPSRFSLQIYGDGEKTYVEKLKKDAADLAHRVHFNGIVSGLDKTKAYLQADIFVLPSQSENFGIVVAEALAAGIPAITTTNTPWQEIEVMGCGRCVDLEDRDLSAEIVSLANQDLGQMGAAGRAWMQRSFSNSSLSQQLYNIYSAMAHNTLPKNAHYE